MGPRVGFAICSMDYRIAPRVMRVPARRQNFGAIIIGRGCGGGGVDATRDPAALEHVSRRVAAAVKAGAAARHQGTPTEQQPNVDVHDEQTALGDLSDRGPTSRTDSQSESPTRATTSWASPESPDNSPFGGSGARTARPP